MVRLSEFEKVLPGEEIHTLLVAMVDELYPDGGAPIAPIQIDILKDVVKRLVALEHKHEPEPCYNRATGEWEG